ncbi:MAG: hypothetical protein JWM55_7 [Acidimicrobiaceae bacterium]|nr:hypothetical protein [Acidimicrobiaceae bacterium]
MKLSEVPAITSTDDVSDDELTAMALAADPTAPVDEDAEPWHFGYGFIKNPLPDWYMPLPMASRRGRGTRAVVVSVVVGLVVICAFGLCVTSGFLQLA